MRYRNSKYSTNRKGGFAPQKGRASTQRRQPIQNQNRQTIRSTNRPAVNQRQPFQGRSGYYGSPARKRGLGRAIFFLCAIFALGCVGFKFLFHHDGPTKADNPSIQAGAPVAQDGNTIIPDITIHQGDLVLVNREAPYQEDPNPVSYTHLFTTKRAPSSLAAKAPVLEWCFSLRGIFGPICSQRRDGRSRCSD